MKTSPMIFSLRSSSSWVTCLTESCLRRWTDRRIPRTQNTVKSRFNNLRFNDIPGITINSRFPGKSYSKMYEAEPRFNDIRFNPIRPGFFGVLGRGGGGASKAPPHLHKSESIAAIDMKLLG